MKTLQTLVAGLSLAVVIGQPLTVAAAPAGGEPAWLSEAFAEGAALDQAHALDETAMTDSRGQLAPLIGVVAGIAGLDLALMSFYWGYYIPTVSSGGGACTGCNTMYSQH